jgi:hypothetical protein
MPDIETRLRNELGLRPVKTTWLEAWDLRGAAKSQPPAAPKESKQPEKAAASA